MKLTKCENGHFYDGDKFPACPYCDPALQGESGIVQAGTAAPAATPAAAEGPVAGWLVAVAGPGCGRDLRIGEGRNYRAPDPQRRRPAFGAYRDRLLRPERCKLHAAAGFGQRTLLPQRRPAADPAAARGRRYRRLWQGKDAVCAVLRRLPAKGVA